MKSILSFILLIVIILPNYAQVIEKVDARVFTIVSDKGDTINFLKTNARSEKKKPTILFCQGSFPIPMVIYDSLSTYIPSLNNFDYKQLSEKFNFIVISMPHTPPVASIQQLNSRSQYVPNINQQAKFDSLYLRDNYLENYVNRANCVIKFLMRQPWVDPKRIAVLGHSQGSYIATILAESNPNIVVLGYLSGNPNGRFTNYIRFCRRAVSRKEMTPAQAQERIKQYYDLWKSYCKGIIPEGINGDPALTWTSFTIPLFEHLAKLKKPIFVGYGTEDLDSAEGCDLLPIYFDRVGKTNYLMKPYVGCGHNFEEISSSGFPNYDKMHWNDLMNDFVNWFEKVE